MKKRLAMKVELINPIGYNETNVEFTLQNEKGESIGAIDIMFDLNGLFIEHIIRDEKYKGHRVLEGTVNELVRRFKQNIYCIPLEQYRSYYKQLGFKHYKTHEYSYTNEVDEIYELKVA